MSGALRFQRFAAIIAGIGIMIAACGDDNGSTEPAPSSDGAATSIPTDQVGCADVVGGSVSESGEAFTVSATVSSADTGEEKYADRWEVRAPDGTVLGERILTHPHVNEQPFTRSLNDVEIPAGVDEVVLAAHDSVAGFCGETFTTPVER